MAKKLVHAIFTFILIITISKLQVVNNNIILVVFLLFNN